MHRILTLSTLIAVLAILAHGSPVVAQEPAAADAPAAKVPEGRLPSYYRDVVTPNQRDQIYIIQAKYDTRISDLEKQLLALVKQRNAEVAGVLTPQQITLVEKLANEAKSRRDKFKESFQAAIDKAKEEAKAAVQAVEAIEAAKDAEEAPAGGDGAP